MTSSAISQALAQERAAVKQGIEAQQQKLQSLSEEYRRQYEQVAGALRELRTQFNALAPVSRLPPELLSRVFLACAAAFHEAPILRHLKSSLAWLAILEVCHHWRLVAIATPQLWAHVLLAHKAYVAVALQRSRSAPLHLRSASYSYRHLRDVYLAAQSEISRIRSIELIINPTAVQSLRKLDLSALQAGLPVLEELHLVCSVDDIPPALSSLHMPRLRSLKIVEGLFSYTSSLVRPTITHLAVTFRYPVAMSSLLDVLDRMPLLQHLELCDIYDAHPPFPIVNTRTIPLPHLTHIHLDGKIPVFGLSCLLQCLAFLEGAHIGFHWQRLPAGEGTYNFERCRFVLPIVFSRAFLSDLPGRDSSRRCRPRVLVLRTKGFRLRLWGPSASPHDLDDKAYLQQLPHLDVNFGPRCALPESTPSFLDLLDLSELSVLDISPHAMSCDFWIGFFRRMMLPNLEQLHLSDKRIDDCETLFKALGTPIVVDSPPTVDQNYDSGHVAPSEHYVFPGLHTIRLDGMLLAGRTFHGDATRDTSCNVLQDLITILHRRAEAGSKLKTLTINSCKNLTAQDYALLRDPSIYLATESVEIGGSGEQ